MNWANLKKNTCPKCNKRFGETAFIARAGFIVCPCGFQINEMKFQEIVSSKVNRDLAEKEEQEEENL